MFSFQGTYAERTILGWRGEGGSYNGRRGRRNLLCAGGCSGRGLDRGNTIEECGGRDEEQTSSDRSAEVEDAIVIAGRTANEHIFEHLFDGARRAAVADEIGAELAVAGPTEGHVVAEDFDFPAVFFDDGEGVVGGGGLDRVVEFDVGDFYAADDLFLDFGRDPIPGVEIVKILLNDDVASAGESGIFVANEDGVDGCAARGIFGAVHKAEEIAFIEVAEAVDFVGGSDGPFEASHDLGGELETEIHALGTDVKD